MLVVGLPESAGAQFEYSLTCWLPVGLVCTAAQPTRGSVSPADELDRLFSRFFRASTATANAVPGVGLG